MDFQRSRNGPMFQKPRWMSCYSSQHLILLVGEGNFSFSATLANAFGAALNMVATSLDSKDELLKKYGMTAEWNTINLIERGALVFHGFDACKMAIHQKNLLKSFQLSLFNCIVFNFPHAGFLGKENDAQMLRKHRELVRNFFANAKELLLPGGQVHVRHKVGHPYDEWKLEELAHSTGLKLVGRVPFHLGQFPGYQNCRGDGFRADESFRLGPADTFIFVASWVEEPPPKTSQIKARSRKKQKQKQVEMKEKQVEKEKQVTKTIFEVIAEEDLGLSDPMLAQLKCLKEKIIRRGRGSSETPLHQVAADEVVRLEALEKNRNQLSDKKLRTLRMLKSALQNYNLHSTCHAAKAPSPTVGLSQSCPSSKQISQPPEFQLSTPTDNAENSMSCDSCVSSKTVQVRIRLLKQKAIRKARASDKTTLQQVAADEVSRLEKVKLSLGQKKLQTLEDLKSDLRLMNCQIVEERWNALLLKEKAIRKGRASNKTTLQQVAADEVARLEKVKRTLGPKKLQTLEDLKSDLRLIKDRTGYNLL